MVTLKVDEKVRLTVVAVDKYGNVVDNVQGQLSWSVDGSSASVGADGWLVAGTVAGGFNVTATMALASGGSLSAVEPVTVSAGEAAALKVEVAEGPVAA